MFCLHFLTSALIVSLFICSCVPSDTVPTKVVNDIGVVKSNGHTSLSHSALSLLRETLSILDFKDMGIWIISFPRAQLLLFGEVRWSVSLNHYCLLSNLPSNCKSAPGFLLILSLSVSCYWVPWIFTWSVRSWSLGIHRLIYHHLHITTRILN